MLLWHDSAAVPPPATDDVNTAQMLVEAPLKRLSELSCQLRAVWTWYTRTSDTHSSPHSFLTRLCVKHGICLFSESRLGFSFTTAFAHYTRICNRNSFSEKKEPLQQVRAKRESVFKRHEKHISSEGNWSLIRLKFVPQMFFRHVICCIHAHNIRVFPVDSNLGHMGSQSCVCVQLTELTDSQSTHCACFMWESVFTPNKITERGSVTSD